jgi:hypothetical protein
LQEDDGRRRVEKGGRGGSQDRFRLEFEWKPQRGRLTACLRRFNGCRRGGKGWQATQTRQEWQRRSGRPRPLFIPVGEGSLSRSGDWSAPTRVYAFPLPIATSLAFAANSDPFLDLLNFLLLVNTVPSPPASSFPLPSSSRPPKALSNTSSRVEGVQGEPSSRKRSKSGERGTRHAPAWRPLVVLVRPIVDADEAAEATGRTQRRRVSTYSTFSQRLPLTLEHLYRPYRSSRQISCDASSGGKLATSGSAEEQGSGRSRGSVFEKR